MSIKVVCGCGFCTLLPSGWEGRRVKCKCGRTFVVGSTGGAGTQSLDVPPATGRIALPVAEPEPSAAVVTSCHRREPELTPAADRVPPPAPEPTPSADNAGGAPGISAATASDARRPASGEPARSRGRYAVPQQAYRTPDVRRSALAFLTMLMALTSVCSRGRGPGQHDWSITAMLGMEYGNESSRPPSDVPGESEPAARRGDHRGLSKSGASDAPEGGTPDAAAGSGEGTTTRLANLSDLISEDGLLLTGMFGEGSRRLGLNDEQQATIRGVAARLKENEQELKTKKLTLEQWYAACRKLGDESLAVLTDAQRQMLRAILERKEMQRVLLVEYSALIVPELAVAQMPWSVPTAGRSFRTISQSSFTAPAQDRCYRRANRPACSPRSPSRLPAMPLVS